MEGIGKGESYLAQSVKVYFQEEHEDEIYDAICSRIGEHPEELEESFSDLHRMGELTLEEIKVMSVYTEWKSEDELQFEISTCATVDCDEGDHHYDDMRSTYKWYTVKGTGSLDNLLEDFSITNVVPYLKGKRHSARALKDTFVPDIKKENLDNVAEQILKKYYPEALKQPMAIDTDILLKRIGLSKIERRISKDASVFGRIYFEDAESAFYNDEVDFLTKKRKKNEGEVPKYYVTGNHEPIIPPATFELVQAEIERRRAGKRYSGVTIFSQRIKCGECGYWYGSKVWHSNDKYRRVVYQCNYKFEGAEKCSTPHLVEDEIKAAFIKAVGKLLKGKADMLENIRLVQEKICGTEKLEAESQRLMGELQMLSDMVQKCINENARIAQDQTDYQQCYNELVSRYDATRARYDEVEKAIKARKVRAERLDGFAKALKA